MSPRAGVRREAFFLDTPGGARFCIATYPAGAIAGSWLHIPAFAEEMNKSRRQVALAAEALARRGWLVLQIDLKGCGDSQGDFGDAAWSDWIDDVSAGWSWLENQSNETPGLWALRAGSLLAADWLNRHTASPSLLLWQPVVDGSKLLTQFLRLKAASEMMSSAEARGVVMQLRKDLEDGLPIEVAGYSLAPALTEGLSASRLTLPSSFDGRVMLIEVSSMARDEPGPAYAKLVSDWRSKHVSLDSAVVQGPGFWQTLEIETCVPLIEASVALANE